MTRLASEEFEFFGDDLAPNFELSISGHDISGASEIYQAVRPLIEGVTFEDDEELSSLLEITINNQPDTAPGKPVDWRAVIDSKAFSEGNEIDLWMGYGANMEYMDRTQIVKWLPKFPETGPASFTIKGFDGRHALMAENKFKTKGTKKRKSFYKKMTDDQIVVQLAKKHGYAYSVDTAQAKKRAVKKVVSGKTVVQHVLPTRVQAPDVSDWQFMRRLARINRFDLWVDFDRTVNNWVVHFKEREETASPGYLFEYNVDERGESTGSLISAEPDFSIKDQSTDIEVFYYDKKKRAV